MLLLVLLLVLLLLVLLLVLLLLLLLTLLLLLLLLTLLLFLFLRLSAQRQLEVPACVSVPRDLAKRLPELLGRLTEEIAGARVVAGGRRRIGLSVEREPRVVMGGGPDLARRRRLGRPQERLAGRRVRLLRQEREAPIELNAGLGRQLRRGAVVLGLRRLRVTRTQRLVAIADVRVLRAEPLPRERVRRVGHRQRGGCRRDRHERSKRHHAFDPFWPAPLTRARRRRRNAPTQASGRSASSTTRRKPGTRKRA